MFGSIRRWGFFSDIQICSATHGTKLIRPTAPSRLADPRSGIPHEQTGIDTSGFPVNRQALTLPNTLRRFSQPRSCALKIQLPILTAAQFTDNSLAFFFWGGGGGVRVCVCMCVGVTLVFFSPHPLALLGASFLSLSPPPPFV